MTSFFQRKTLKIMPMVICSINPIFRMILSHSAMDRMILTKENVTSDVIVILMDGCIISELNDCKNLSLKSNTVEQKMNTWS